jgi:hypothetical protein
MGAINHVVVQVAGIAQVLLGACWYSVVASARNKKS